MAVGVLGAGRGMAGADRTPGQGTGRDPHEKSAPGADGGREPGLAERRRIALEMGRRRFAALERARAGEMAASRPGTASGSE